LKRFYPIERTEARKKVGWNEEDYHVLFPYSPKYERKRYPLAESVVESASERLGEKINLHTLSGVPHEQMIHYLNASDVLLLTSRHEGSPNTVKESMACNVPVVSTNVGDVKKRLSNVSPSVVGSDETELIEGILEVIRTGKRSNGREAIRELSWENTSKRIVDIYQTVLSQP
jgi:glycosyltransferase involved in cell wall biosynthesis